MRKERVEEGKRKEGIQAKIARIAKIAAEIAEGQ